VIVPLDMTKRPYIPQQDVSYMAGYGVAIKNSFINLVPPRGTDWRFKSPPHPIHTRYAACLKNTINYEEIVFHDDIYFDHDFSSRTGY
jgi:hypothetical protein